jgi:N-acetylglucosaminyl-diphospho-decaprenol L-rhamnosyltransferase
MALLNIIIINWNAGDLLFNCINSVLGSDLSSESYSIYVIDNNSTDNSLALIENISPNVHVFESKVNLGFGKACNYGAKMEDSEYLLFLNPDTMIGEHTLKESIDYLNRNPGVTVLGCKHLDENGNIKPSCSRFPTFRNSLNDIFGISKIFPKKFKSAALMTDWDHSESRFVDQVMGAYFLIRRKNFDLLNGFDEQFFIYYEDSDLARRVTENGGSVYYNSQISIFHAGMGTTNKVKDLRLFYSLSSQFKYHKKYFKPYQNIILFSLVHLVELPLRVINAFLKEGWHGAKEVLVGFSMLHRKNSYPDGSF